MRKFNIIMSKLSNVIHGTHDNESANQLMPSVCNK